MRLIIQKIVGQKLVYLSILCLSTFYMYLLFSKVVAFPNWGDDFGFIDAVRKFTFEGITLSQFYYPFHNGIHVNFLMKLYLWIQFSLFGIINYKVSIISSQLLILMGIMYIFHQFFKRQSIGILQQITCFVLLFSVKGNWDNFGLLGVLQHTFTVFCICLTAYLITLKQKPFAAFIVVNLTLFLCSTEILGALFLFLFWAIISKKQYWYMYVFLSLFNIGFYYVGIKYSNEIHHIQGSAIHLNGDFVKGLLLFTGGLFSNLSIDIALGVFFVLVVTVSFWKIPGTVIEKINSPSFFSVFIFLALLGIGVMIQLGREDSPGVGHAFSTSIDARFSYYHLFFLISVILSIRTWPMVFQKFGSIVCFVFSCLLYGYRLPALVHVLDLDKNRILADAYNYQHFQENSNYEIGSAMALKIVRSNMLEFPDFKELVHKSHHMVVETYQMQQDPNFTYIRFKCPRLCRFAEIVTSQNKSFLVAVDIQTPVDAVIRIGSFWLENHTIKKIILHN